MAVNKSEQKISLDFELSKQESKKKSFSELEGQKSKIVFF